MRNTRLLTLLVSHAVAVLFFVLYPTSYALAQNATTDDSPTAERIERTDDSPTAERIERTDIDSPSQNTWNWRKARLDVQVDVVGGSAKESDFVIQVTSSSTDQSVKLDQYPETFEGDREFILQVSNVPSSPINYDARLIDQPDGDYSIQYEGCSGSWELGVTKTCKIISYFEPQPSDFQIVASPNEMTVKPESSSYSTLTLIPSQDNSRDAIINVELYAEWVGTAPNSDDVSVTLEQGSTRLVGTERRDIGLTIRTSQDAPPGQTFTLSVIADGEVDQQDQPVSRTVNIQMTIPPSNNNPPEAIATLDKEEVEEGESVKLDGTGSTDFDKDELSYSWKIITGPSNVQISEEESRKGTLTFETPRVDEDTTITFQLTVSDSKPGGMGIDRTELSIDDLGSNNPQDGGGDRSGSQDGGGDRSGSQDGGGDRSDPLIGAIPPQIRDVAGGFIPSVAGPSNNNIFPLLVPAAIIVVGGIAIAKYKMNRGSNRRIKIPPSALVEIKAKGGIDQ